MSIFGSKSPRKNFPHFLYSYSNFIPSEVPRTGKLKGNFPLFLIMLNRSFKLFMSLFESSSSLHFWKHSVITLEAFMGIFILAFLGDAAISVSADCSKASRPLFAGGGSSLPFVEKCSICEECAVKRNSINTSYVCNQYTRFRKKMERFR